MTASTEPERRPAPPDLERRLSEDFPFRTMSPEEYAARTGADTACFSLDEYVYCDPALDAWIRRVGEVFSDWELVNQYRRQYLTPEEVQRAIERDQEEW